MKNRNKNMLFTGVSLLILFVIWTILVCFVDVKPIGPRGSSVGFASLNGYVHSLTGVNISLYTLTDWLGLVPIAVAFVFAIIGFAEWIKRKSLCKVDRSLILLGGFYIVVMAVYILFEFVVINYRPVLINEYLEPSYPSSTTMLAMCVMPTAIMQLGTRIKNIVIKRCVVCAILAFTAFMVIGRLICGVHWLSDIIGGALFSAGLVTVYHSISGEKN